MLLVLKNKDSLKHDRIVGLKVLILAIMRNHFSIIKIISISNIVKTFLGKKLILDSFNVVSYLQPQGVPRISQLD